MHAATHDMVTSEVSRLEADIETNAVKSQVCKFGQSVVLLHALLVSCLAPPGRQGMIPIVLQEATCSEAALLLQETLTDVGGIQTSIADLTEQIQACVTQEDYEHRVSLQATKADLENLQEKANDLQNLLTAQQEFVESLDTHKEDKRSAADLSNGVEALKLDVQQLRVGKSDVESTEAIKEELAAVVATISTFATVEATETMRSDVDGLVAKCQELESTKANLSDLQSTINTMDQLQEYSNVGIAALKDMTSSMKETLQDQKRQLDEQKESTSSIQEQLEMKANSEDAKKLQDDMQQIQQQAETFATVSQVETISQAVESVQQGLKESTERMDENMKSIGDGQSNASAEFATALDALQQKQQAAFDEHLASIRDSLEQLQAQVDQQKADGAQAVGISEIHEKISFRDPVSFW